MMFLVPPPLVLEKTKAVALAMPQQPVFVTAIPKMVAALVYSKFY